MKYNPHKHHRPFGSAQGRPFDAAQGRRSIRLKGYDYSQPGWYFVTIVTQNREMLFGDVVDGEMGLNDAGKIAIKFWLEIPEHFSHVDLDEFIVMPNHIHGIIVIKNNVMENVNVVGAKNLSPLQQQPSKFHSPSKTIGSIVRGFKIGVTKWFRNHTDIYNVWQRNYWDHIIRNENELNRIRQYIIDNPKKWDNDRYFG